MDNMQAVIAFWDNFDWALYQRLLETRNKN